MRPHVRKYIETVVTVVTPQILDMNEKALEKKLQQKVKSLGGMALKFSSIYFTGMPDRIVLMPKGKTWFVELKSTGGKTTARQDLVIADLRKLDFPVFIIDSFESLTEFLNEIVK